MRTGLLRALLRLALLLCFAAGPTSAQRPSYAATLSNNYIFMNYFNVNITYENFQGYFLNTYTVPAGALTHFPTKPLAWHSSLVTRLVKQLRWAALPAHCHFMPLRTCDLPSRRPRPCSALRTPCLARQHHQAAPPPHTVKSCPVCM